MIKGAIGIVGLGVVMWAVGCGTHSGIGTLGMGGEMGLGGQVVGMGGQVEGTGGTAMGGQMEGTGGTGMGGAIPGIGGQRASCPPVPSAIGTAKTLTFAAPTDYSTGAGAFEVTTGDLNGDGKLDLLLLDQTAGIRIMFNKGDGTFNGPADLGYPGGGRVVVGDIDGNGQTDIVQLTSSGVSVILNKGNAAFAPAVNYVVGYQSVALVLGDLNGDGKLDVAVADQGGINSGADVGILMNTGGGTFVAGNYPVANIPNAIAIGDLDNDCIPDLALAGPAGVSVLVNRGDGSFSSATNFAYGTSGTSIAIGDLNGDGQLDIVEGMDGVANVLINHGYASFNAPIVYTATCTPTTSNGVPGQPLVLADLNGDGRPDLLNLESYCGGLTVLPNHGDGSFPASLNFPTAPPTPAWIATGDLNGDGRPDVAVVSHDYSVGSELRVLINTSH